MNVLLAVSNSKDRALLAGGLQRFFCKVLELDMVHDLYAAYLGYRPALLVLDADIYIEGGAHVDAIKNARLKDDYLSILVLCDKRDRHLLSDYIKPGVDVLDSPCDELDTAMKIRGAVRGARLYQRMLLKQKRSTAGSYEDFRYESVRGILERMASPCRQSLQNIKH